MEASSYFGLPHKLEEPTARPSEANLLETILEEMSENLTLL
jgi:hypothetical protein